MFRNLVAELLHIEPGPLAVDDGFDTLLIVITSDGVKLGDGLYLRRP